MDIQELCAKLKGKRKELGLSIEEVVEKTKIYPSAIRDIEEGNLANVNPTYLKGFIKIYASFLSIPLEDALEHIASLDKGKIRKEAKPKKEKKPLSPKFKKLLLASLSLAVIIFVLIFFVRFMVIQVGRLFKKPGTKKEVAVASPVSKAAKEVAVALVVRKNCFLRVKVDGKLIFVGMLKKGSKESWKARKEIELRLSDGSAVYIEVNGKALPALTSVHKPIKKLRITPQEILVDK